MADITRQFNDQTEFSNEAANIRLVHSWGDQETISALFTIEAGQSTGRKMARSSQTGAQVYVLDANRLGTLVHDYQFSEEMGRVIDALPSYPADHEVTEQSMADYFAPILAALETRSTWWNPRPLQQGGAA